MLLFSRVHAQVGVLHGEVDAVVDVERERVLVLHARVVDVGLVGDDQRGADRADRRAELFLVVADGRDHHARSRRRACPISFSSVNAISAGGVAVAEAVDRVADVVQIAGDGGELGVRGRPGRGWR